MSDKKFSESSNFGSVDDDTEMTDTESTPTSPIPRINEVAGSTGPVNQTDASPPLNSTPSLTRPGLNSLRSTHPIHQIPLPPLPPIPRHSSNSTSRNAPSVSFVPSTSEPESGAVQSNDTTNDEDLARRLQAELDRESNELDGGDPIPPFILRLNPLPMPIPIARSPTGSTGGPQYTLLDYLQILAPSQSSYPTFPGQNEDDGEEEEEVDPYNDIEEETNDTVDEEDDEDDGTASPDQPHPLVNIILNMLNQSNRSDSINLARIMAGEASYEELLHLSDLIPVVSRGADPASIEALPTHKFSSQPQIDILTPGGIRIPVPPTNPSIALSPGTLSREKCIICLCEYEDTEEIVELPTCRHQFHKACASEWLKINKICPICRVEIPTQHPPPSTHRTPSHSQSSHSPQSPPQSQPPQSPPSPQ
jgi:hypothetical protein